MDNYSTNTQKIKVKPIHIIVVIAIFAIFFLLVISLQSLFRKNPFGSELKIDNFSQYYKNIPDETRDSIFASLYNTAKLNINEDQEVPTSGALIRNQSNTESYNENTQIYSGNFIVDVEAIKQSFTIYMEWSKSSNNSNLSGYTVTVNCLTGASSAYQSSTCIDMFTNNSDNKIASKYPLIYKLPIEVSEYNNNYTKYTHYTITYTIDNDSKITVYITDYTGGNHDAAIKKIKDLGFVPEQYNIKYVDKSSEQIPGRPADYDF